nr:glycerophosphodiester phosphodiesterase family protein [Corynebacterium sp. TAE3-ERU12]
MEVVAHRGASGTVPEHTLAAYAEAVAQGADGIECDVRLTADGHLVCIHDDSVDRTTDGTGLVRQMTLAQLRELNAGTADSPQPVLDFDTFLRFVNDHPQLTVFVETKHRLRDGRALERRLADQLAEHHLSADPRLRVISFAARSLKAMARLAPAVERIQLVDMPGVRSFARRSIAQPTYMGVDIVHARRHTRTHAHTPPQWGSQLYTWVANRPDDVEFAFRHGVRWLATDYPDRARRALADVDLV